MRNPRLFKQGHLIPWGSRFLICKRWVGLMIRPFFHSPPKEHPLYGRHNAEHYGFSRTDHSIVLISRLTSICVARQCTGLECKMNQMQAGKGKANWAGGLKEGVAFTGSVGDIWQEGHARQSQTAARLQGHPGGSEKGDRNPADGQSGLWGRAPDGKSSDRQLRVGEGSLGYSTAGVRLQLQLAPGGERARFQALLRQNNCKQPPSQSSPLWTVSQAARTSRCVCRQLQHARRSLAIQRAVLTSPGPLSWGSGARAVSRPRSALPWLSSASSLAPTPQPGRQRARGTLTSRHRAAGARARSGHPGSAGRRAPARRPRGSRFRVTWPDFRWAPPLAGAGGQSAGSAAGVRRRDRLLRGRRPNGFPPAARPAPAPAAAAAPPSPGPQGGVCRLALPSPPAFHSARGSPPPGTTASLLEPGDAGFPSAAAAAAAAVSPAGRASPRPRPAAAVSPGGQGPRLGGERERGRESGAPPGPEGAPAALPRPPILGEGIPRPATHLSRRPRPAMGAGAPRRSRPAAPVVSGIALSLAGKGRQGLGAPRCAPRRSGRCHCPPRARLSARSGPEPPTRDRWPRAHSAAQPLFLGCHPRGIGVPGDLRQNPSRGGGRGGGDPGKWKEAKLGSGAGGASRGSAELTNRERNSRSVLLKWDCGAPRTPLRSAGRPGRLGPCPSPQPFWPRGMDPGESGMRF